MRTRKCVFSSPCCQRQWENAKQWIFISHLHFHVCCQMPVNQFWGKGRKEKLSGRWGSRWGRVGAEPPTPPNCRQQPPPQQDCCLLEAGCFVVLFRVWVVFVFFKQIQASSPPAQPGSHFFMLCFPGCSLVHGDWSHCFQVSLQVIRKKEDLLGLRSLRKISLPSFPWTRFSGHNNTVSPRQVYPLKTLSLINNFFLI